ncbi:glycolipid transfer protein-like isoform X2 [Arapaima gigas]
MIRSLLLHLLESALGQKLGRNSRQEGYFRFHLDVIFVLSTMALLMDHQFKELPADRQVDTKAFLDSVSYLPSFFDCLGSKVFAPIKADIAGNVTKIQTVYDTDPAQFATLQQILEVEKELHRSEWPKVGATLALMWLKRGLRFIQIMLQSLVDGEKDEKNPNLIRANATKAYEGALKRYHGWFVQNMFKVIAYHPSSFIYTVLHTLVGPS